ncbi:uncharacterized protein LOC109812492 isoform X2 [Cajanus cajan]|uniref:uncharacterized protein LOC109812492 isoform X2 n=1 Tax=Cajanus cajan TaxID=3821 RepID=UPI0010FB784C|nr:uncharacterized protein LOC109812492 isoform X2 [Cajanus cajan]
MSEMEEREIERREEIPLFSEKTKLAQKSAMANRWEEFKKIMKEDKENLLKWFDLFGNNAIHVATRSNNPKLLKELIEMVPIEDRWQAMYMENRQGNTILHEIVFCKKVQMADVVFEKEDELLQQEEEVEDGVEKRASLIEHKNRRGETPFFMAAMYGKLKMLKHMANRIATHNMGNFRKHLHRSEYCSALHASVIGQYFDVAIWLVRMDKELALEKDEKGSTCLQLLSKMPQVFRSHAHMGLIKSLIYTLLPDDGYEIEDGETLCLFKHKTDLENGKIDERKLPKSVISKINYKFWKRLATEFEGLDHMWKQKKKHKLAESLANILVQYDLSWQISHNDHKWITLITMPHLPFNVAKRRRLSESKRQERHKVDKESLHERIPLLMAAKTGIIEIVEKILEANPSAIFHVTKHGQNILNMAIQYRQKKVIRIIRKKGALESLFPQITDKGRTILHEVARMDYYKPGRLAGVAFQLQDELRWYDQGKW